MTGDEEPSAPPVSHDRPVHVVGGGITGLATALFLVRSGHAPRQIVVFERRPRWGGHSRTVYLFRDQEGRPRLIRDHDVAFPVDGEPCLVPRGAVPGLTAVSGEEPIPLSDPRFFPCDVGFTITTRRYQNLRALLDLLPPQAHLDVSMGSSIVRRYDLGDGVSLRSDRPFMGLLGSPGLWWSRGPELYRLRRDIRGFLDATEDADLATCTVAGLLDRHDLHDRVITRLCAALVCLYSGWSPEVLPRTSARYFLDFLRMANMEEGFDQVSTTQLGNAVLTAVLCRELEAAGVQLRAGTAYAPREGDPAAVVYTAHPWRVPELADLAFPWVRVPVAVHPVGGPAPPWHARYRHTDEECSATLYIDGYRGRPGGLGVALTFGVGTEDAAPAVPPSAAATVESWIPIEDYAGQPLDTAGVVQTWEHALVTPAFEASRAAVEARQGQSDRWYASSSLVGSARHEDGVTSALRAVIRMKGAEAAARLAALGLSPSPPSRH